MTIDDIKNIEHTVQEAIQLKKNPSKFENLGKNKTLVMLFFNASLRTRLSTEKAAKTLGMNVMVLNIDESLNLLICLDLHVSKSGSKDPDPQNSSFGSRYNIFSANSKKPPMTFAAGNRSESALARRTLSSASTCR